jgi:two-component system, OmpR family, sensor kinase
VSLRLRLTLLNSLILLLVGGALVAAVYAVLSRNLQQQLDMSLRDQAQLYAANTSLWFDRGARRPRGVILPSLQRFTAGQTFIQVLTREGEIQARSQNLDDDVLPLPLEARRTAVAGREWFGQVEVDDQLLRQYVAPLRVGGTSEETPTMLVIQVARPLATLTQTLRALQVAVLAVGSVGVLVSLVAGWLLARAALRPIDRLATTADAIGARRDFSLRVPEPPSDHDEVGRLASAFNRMLGELQASHEQLGASLVAQRRFVADASHELRTPLATLRGNVELLQYMARAEGLDDARQEEILRDLGAESQRMGRLIGDLLLLAQADAGQHLTLRPLDVAMVVREAVRSARVLRDDVRLDDSNVEDGLWVNGHEDRLRQVMLILLDNALKYSPPGGQVTLAARHAPGGGIDVRVSDTGPGIPIEEQGRIFDRFYRGAAGRSGEGTGLGLSIARWIVEEHHGRIEVASEPGGGATFSVWLPGASASNGRNGNLAAQRGAKAAMR